MKKHPYFSVIIPVYNRERFIGRTLESCLKQDFGGFEIIVVDDCSTDCSVEVVRSFVDKRIKLVQHTTNRGVCPARNTGINIAKGEWVVCLDSDDELLPGALATMYEKSQEVGNDIARLQFMCRFDTGQLSPNPPLKDEIWDYEGYIKWNESYTEGFQESLPIVRLSTFKVVSYSNDRALENLYHLDFAKHFLTRACPEVVRLYHHDAPNQLTKPCVNRTLLSAADRAKNLETVLDRHGDVLSKLAPKRFLSLISGLATLQFLCGRRIKAMHYLTASLKRKPFSLQTWAVVAFGLLGPKPLAWLRVQKSRWSSAIKTKQICRKRNMT